LSLVSSKNGKVFLCKDTKINAVEKIDIILSPEFYWVRLFDIPVKTVSQARHVLPTLFEDILENVKELSYQVVKQKDDKFLCFAYENKKIFEAIKDSGVNLSLVNAVYFGQNECINIPQFINNGKAFSYTQDGILVKIPNALLSEEVKLEDKINSISLSSNKVDIKLYNNLLSSKQISFILVACVLFSVLNLYRIFIYNSEIEKLDENISAVKSSSNMPSSMLQVNSIINSQKKDVKLQIAKRDAIDYVLKNKTFKLKSIDIQNDLLILDFENADKNEVEEYLSKKYKIASSNVRNMNLNVRIKLWKDSILYM